MKTSDRPVYQFEIQVVNPEKIEGMVKPFVVYQVKTKTNAPQYTQREFSVTRRYRDFRWLVKQLTARYPGLIVPPVPEKQALGRFSPDFIEYRRRALEKCLQRIGQHPILQMSHDFRTFLEIAEDFESIAGDLERETRRGFFDKLGDVVSSALSFSKTSEVDDWFEQKRLRLDIMETQLHSLHKSLEQMIRCRKELGLLSTDTAECVLLLRRNHTLHEDGDNLGFVLEELAEAEKEMATIHLQQATCETTTLMATVDEYERLIGSIKKALGTRQKSLEQWQSLESSLHKKRDVYEKIKSSLVKGDKLMMAQRDVHEAESKASTAQNEFDDLSLQIRDEIELFEQLRIGDFHQSTREFMAHYLSHQEKVSKSLCFS
jgi:sorting nexin-1/2